MKSWPNLIIIIGLVISYVLISLTNNEFIEAIILMSLSILAIVMILIDFKMRAYTKREVRISEIISLIIIICSLIYIVFGKLQMHAYL